MQQQLYIGSNGHVCAIDPQTGTEIWRTRLGNGVFNATRAQDVSVLFRDETVYAGCNGKLFALSASTGEIRWENELQGLGYNDISLSMDGVAVQFLQKVIRQNTN